jgi:hypothetical protein
VLAEELYHLRKSCGVIEMQIEERVEALTRKLPKGIPIAAGRYRICREPIPKHHVKGYDIAAHDRIAVTLI